MLTLLFNATSNTFVLPPDLLSSLCFIESSHKVSAIHLDDGGSNSVGICQLKLSTARWLGFNGTEKQLMDPAINIYYSGLYLSRLITRYSGNLDKAVIAYNMGHAGSFEHTKYSDKVMKKWGGKICSR